MTRLNWIPGRSLLGAVLVLAWAPGVMPTRVHAPRGRRDACAIRVASTPLVLDDGASVSIDPSALVTDGVRVLALGTPTIVWPSGAGDSAMPPSEQRGIGALVEPTGRVRIVPMPPGHDDVQFPRAVPAGRGRFHVLFVTGKYGAPGSPIAFDTATIWYGLLEGERWTGVTPVGRARSAYLAPRMASPLVLIGGEPLMAYAFDRSHELQSNARGSQGLVLLSWHDRRWRDDTLFTPDGPRGVGLVPDHDGGGVTAWFAQREVRDGRLQPASLYTAHHRSSWSAVTRRYTSEAGHVNTPTAVEGMLPRTIAWRIEAGAADSTDLVEWAHDEPGLQPLAHRTLDRSIQPLETIAAVELDRQRIAFVVRDKDRQGKVGVALASPDGIELHRTEVIADNPSVAAAYGGRSSMLVLTTRLGATDREPRVQTTLSRLQLTCPGTRAPRDAATGRAHTFSGASHDEDRITHRPVHGHGAARSLR